MNNSFINLSPKNMDGSPKGKIDSRRSVISNDSEIDDINENLLEKFESEIFRLQNEIRQRDQDIEVLVKMVEENEAGKNKENSQAVVDGYIKHIKNLDEKIQNLSEELCHEKRENHFIKKCLEEARNEIMRLKEEGNAAHERDFMLPVEGKLSRNPSKAGSYGEQSPPFNFTPMYGKEKDIAGGWVIDEDMLSTGESEMPHLLAPLVLDKSSFSKLNDSKAVKAKMEFLKEKLANEERRCKELEYMMGAQKNIMDINNEKLLKLESEKKVWENQMDEMRKELVELREAHSRDQAKLGHMSSFYKIMNEANQQQESPDLLNKVEGIVPKERSTSPETRKRPNTMTHRNRKANFSFSLPVHDPEAEDNDGSFYREEWSREIDSLKNEIGQLATAVQKMNDSNQGSRHGSFGNKNINPMFEMIYGETPGHRKTNSYLVNAVKNSNGFWGLGLVGNNPQVEDEEGKEH